MASSVARISAGTLIKEASRNNKILKLIRKVDPRDRYVVMFPDACHVRVGIGFHLLNVAAAERVYLRASEILNKNFLKLCLEGPHDELCGSIVNRSLAAFVTSCAVVAKLEHERPEVTDLTIASAGIGVGLFNTLVLSNSMSFDDAFDLVKKRAEAIARASQVVPSKTISVLLRPATNLSKVCRAAVEHCQGLGLPPEVAICNLKSKFGPTHIEISGHEKAIEFLETHGPSLFEFRRLNVIESDVPAYHTRLMRPAEDFLRLYIEQKCKERPDFIREPDKTVYVSLGGRRYRGLPEIKEMISKEVTSPALVETLIQRMFARSKNEYQPSILAVWDKCLMADLGRINRKARASTRLLRA